MSRESEEDSRYFRATRENFLRTLDDPSLVKVVTDLVAPPSK